MEDIFLGNKRILILQNIEKNITLSNEMLQRALRAYGHSISVEEVNRHLLWLKERGLLKIDELSASILTAELTRHGKEVAKGIVRESGIDDPVED